ncbi:MAG: 50S ribosomal protein L18 [Ignavibacteria bacterium]|jgi:large subunit ribosomal protein L18
MKRNINHRQKAKIRIRKHVLGTSEKPRMCVYRSLSHVYTQLIDDSNGTVVTSASTLSKEIEADLKKAKGKIEKSKIVGSLLAKKAAEKNISSVVFDRSGYLYHGRIQAVADGAREGGLKL